MESILAEGEKGEKKLVGKVVHYYGTLGVAVVELSAPLKVGDKIVIEGSDAGPVEQTVDSMQIEHENVQEAKPGQSVGLKTAGKVHQHNPVYKLG